MAQEAVGKIYGQLQSKSGLLQHFPNNQNRHLAELIRPKQTSNTRLKTQIDAILQNDLTILSKHPDTPHRALLTTHNNPLILRYVRNIYQEYQLKDPLPERYQKYDNYKETHLPESPFSGKRNQGKIKNKKKIEVTKNLEVGERTVEKQKGYDEGKYLKTQHKEYYRQQEDKNEKKEYQYQSQEVPQGSKTQSFQLKPSQFFSTPPRRKINFIYRCQKTQKTQIITHPTHASSSPSPQHGIKKDDIQNQISIRKSHEIQQNIFRASNSYFDNRTNIGFEEQNSRVLEREGYNQGREEVQQQKPLITFNSTRYESISKPLMPVSRQERQKERKSSQEQIYKQQQKYHPKGMIQSSNIRIQVQQDPYSDVMDQHIQISDFTIPQTKMLSGYGKAEEMEESIEESRGRYLSNREADASSEQKERGQPITSHRFVATRPLPQIITFNYPPQAQQQEISTFRLQPQIQEYKSAQLPSQYATRPEQTSSQLPQQIAQSYRYCLGCQQPLLQANIPAHELKCRRFQQLLDLTPLQLIQYLKKKINIFQDNIRKYSSQLLQADSEEISSHSLKMMEESRMIFDSGNLSEKYNEEYSEVLTVSRKWMGITEEISKVNWFLKVRETIKKQLEI